MAAGNFQAKDLPTLYLKGVNSCISLASAAFNAAKPAIYQAVYGLVTYPKAFWRGGFDAGAATRDPRGRRQWNKMRVSAAQALDRPNGNCPNMMTRGRIWLASLAIALAAGLASGPALAQAPKLIKQYNDWSSFSAVVDGGKTCYILSIPTEKQPSDRDHGDVFFMLAYHAGEASSLQPQFKAGYPFKDDSKVTLDIDGKKYMMFTRGDSAWLENPAEESAVVDSMRNGKSMSVTAYSRRGTQTSYTYSLAGVTASLKDITACK
jgi:hypothetical protein